ncbi:proteasome subunit Alpha type NTN hydrolase [Cryptosporidium ubiquitum]|uniref:Proteasome subunit alpha type n=1 Tax=Cryptosporidium ubiquitum TaxID=857276 RepID=A0A1J4MMF4_9CRYT|nr:proteasome subunit Alpha type NTN hydrolase [Cryptosporidium ubiquitum]OII74188.1 proteasome subunit Alpha type NTN hydrolase [Cryptosporidium ubiquitum]
MTSVGSGYDSSVSTFSPDGRVFQVEYASKAIDNSGTAIAMTYKSGIVFAVDKYVASKMMVAGTNRRVFAIDNQIGCCVAGFITDSNRIVSIARSESLNYQKIYGNPIPIRVLAERIAMYMHNFTLYGSVRPFGCSILLGGLDQDRGIELYCIHPSGSCYKYCAMAVGKGRQFARTDLEKLIDKNLSEEDALYEAARVIIQSREEGASKNLELEMAFIGPGSDFQFSIVPEKQIDSLNERVEKYIDDLASAE